MRILVERLEETPAELSFEADTAWWEAHVPASPDLPSSLDAPLAIRVRGYRMADDLLLEGRLEGGLSLECSRCLARYRHALAEGFRLVLEPAGGRVPADPEGAQALERDGMCLGEDVETGWYQGAEIDLATFFEEIIVTALPVKPLCREDCRGLCSQCGADRNSEDCGCAEIQKPSPFAVLEKLRDGMRKGEQ